MIECFLMGVPLKQVREKYGVVEDIVEKEIEEDGDIDGGKNVISFSPRNQP